MNDNHLKQPSFFVAIEHIWQYSLGIIKDIYHLFTLEVKLAGRSLATIIILAVFAAVLLLASWFSLQGAFVAWLLTVHFSLVLSLFLVSAINLLFVIAVGFYILKISRNLSFRETRKQLGISEQFSVE